MAFEGFLMTSHSTVVTTDSLLFLVYFLPHLLFLLPGSHTHLHLCSSATPSVKPSPTTASKVALPHTPFFLVLSMFYFLQSTYHLTVSVTYLLCLLSSSSHQFLHPEAYHFLHIFFTNLSTHTKNCSWHVLWLFSIKT